MSFSFFSSFFTVGLGIFVFLRDVEQDVGNQSAFCPRACLRRRKQQCAKDLPQPLGRLLAVPGHPRGPGSSMAPWDQVPKVMSPAPGDLLGPVGRICRLESAQESKESRERDGDVWSASVSLGKNGRGIGPSSLGRARSLPSIRPSGGVSVFLLPFQGDGFEQRCMKHPERPGPSLSVSFGW